MIKNILTIAGSDPSGGAGIQADLKTLSALGCYGMSVITSLTAQNSKGVRAIQDVPTDFLEEQLEAIFIDVEVHAVKVGMAGTPQNIDMIAEYLKRFHATPIVLDPVMVATSGDPLLSREAIQEMKEKLIPYATVITPNIPEGLALTERKYPNDREALAKGLLSLGSSYVLLTGGHDEGPECCDILAGPEGQEVLSSPRLPVKEVRGTGCALSTALACFLAEGLKVNEATAKAKAYVTGALGHSGVMKAGRGAKSLHHFYALWD